MREFVRDAATKLRHDELSETLAIVATELATNAIRHAHSPFQVHVTPLTNGVRIAVRDASTVQLRTATPTPQGGRGLLIVAALARDWGTAVTSEGKTVWADLLD